MAKIYSIRKLQSTDALKSKDRQNFLIYIKLSTITGAFWLVLILAEALDVDVLRFIAIVTNGLQGVFIFLSYVCNKRVLNLCKERFGQKPTLTSLGAFPRSRTGQFQQSSTSDMVSDNSQSSVKTTLEMKPSKQKQKKQLKEKTNVSPASRAGDRKMDAMMAELSSTISEVAVSEDSGISAETDSSAA
ncbi:G-protein coupled receptor mth [Plakobranchus ocellatus]|uniref:G-protein coupled receptor mth n=1 Tax=Plakobranchus ocellatus TaxID=259542 RepID=A0AAV4CGM8_9GAST|nr:G-protein coupled receptor mth [Plakobranchus ocellatus]